MNDGMEKTRTRSTTGNAKLKRAKDAAASPEPATILTIGHSNRALEEFLAMLEAHGVERLVDVRTLPRSRHNPQFNTDSLKKSVNTAGIRYTHLKGLGGLRHAARYSINTGWRNASFRGYADYLQTPEFDGALARLTKLAAKKRCAIMCAEAMPWRCHRSLIADALSVRGIGVEHIMSRTSRRAHSLTPFARVRGVELTYPEPSGAAG
jgi:uncharacterized protein (DUF488 family)